jgi:DNA-binding winged helix-turn-helix (wHTH) protein
MPPQTSLSKATAPAILRSWLPDTNFQDRNFAEAELDSDDASSNGKESQRQRATEQLEDSSASNNRIRFGPFLLDCPNFRFLRDGVEVRIRSQVYEVLKVLATRLGCEVRFAELIAEAWKGTSVSRHTVVVTVADARKALAEYRNWIVYRPNRGYRLTIPLADDQMNIGLRMAQRCTREGLEKALNRFRLAAADRFDRRPLDAIARVYLMLGAGSVISPSEALAAFHHAHKHAVDLFGPARALTADRAQAVHLFERHREEAERELLGSVRDQEDPTTYLRLTLLYTGQQRFDCAFASLQRARALDRFDPGLPSAEMFFWLAQSDFQRAVCAGATAIEIQPYFLP